MKKIILPIVILILFSSSAYSEKKSFELGNNFVKYMRAYDKWAVDQKVSIDVKFDAAFFMGYVIGVHDSLSSQISIQEGITIKQVSAIVSKYLKEHPELWNYSGSDIVLKALKEAYPKPK